MRARTARILVLCAMALSWPGTGTVAGEIKPLAADSEDYRTILQITRAYYAAWSYTKDDTAYDQAGRYYSENPNSVYWDPLPPLEGHRGWDEYRNVIPKVWLPAGMVAAGILYANDGSFQAWRIGDVMWTTANCLVHAQFEAGSSTTMPCRGTQIWAREEGGWLVAHEHFSATANPTAPLFQAAGVENTQARPDEEFLALGRELAAAWSAGPIETATLRLRPYYVADIPVRIYMPWAPHDGFQDWNAFDRGLAEYVSLITDKVTVAQRGDLEAMRRGDIAWTTATVHMEFVGQGDTRAGADGRQTLIWARQDGRWLIVHEHLSIPVSQEQK